MPFTLSHPAAVLPLARGPLVPSALVIGSLAPDIPYFFFAAQLRGETHRPLGVVTIDVLIGLAAFAVWHLLWKRPLAALAPAWLRRRLPLEAPVRRAWVVPSLVIGAATHILWDSLTHGTSNLAVEFAWLDRTFGGPALYSWLQWLSGMAGAAVIPLWLVRWVRTVPPRRPRPAENSGRVAVCAAVGAVSAAGGLLSALLLPDWQNLQSYMYFFAVGTIAAAGAALTSYSVWWHAARPAVLQP